MRVMAAKGLIFSVFIAVALIGLFLFLQQSNVIDIDKNQLAVATTTPIEEEPPPPPKPIDIEPQQPLSNPPEVIKAIYATSWSASSNKKMNYLINLIKETELNALVVDIKDYSGLIVYNTELELPYEYDAVEYRIPHLNKFIKRMHDEGIYLIGRISVFQDQFLPEARPDLALFSSSTGQIWGDYKGVRWMDTASKEVWDYNLDVAEEILARGFDEANLDYIRFASDGDLSDIKYPFWDETTLKTHIVRDFFKYARERLPDANLSGDLFGLVTVNTDGLGIGQHMEFGLPYFDAIAPMTYPSHYFPGFIGLENPAEHPYEVIKYSMDAGMKRVKAYRAAIEAHNANASNTPKNTFIGKLRPWFQDFDLGADYGGLEVRLQIQAWEDAASGSPEFFGGWMLWNASNIYSRDGLLPN